MNNSDKDSDWSTALIDLINRPGVDREKIIQGKYVEAEKITESGCSSCDAVTQADEL
ncbi:hypothetical protein [Cohnella sp.]|uniref:hypothetical protein n=1 Tax=Cohnella sp. TaxID=1883426 RepID=UPI003568E1BB